MVDLIDEGSGVYPVDADVRVVSLHALESPDHPPVLHTASRFGDYIDESRLASTTVPEPIKLRGVGKTTLYVSYPGDLYSVMISLRCLTNLQKHIKRWQLPFCLKYVLQIMGLSS